MQGEDIFVGAIREVKEETGVSQFVLPDMEGSR
jgi:8-oxo-dGTP pyrophosphatase MutT (NUDIX family)